MKYFLVLPLALFSLFLFQPAYAQTASISPAFYCIGDNPQPPCVTRVPIPTATISQLSQSPSKPASSPSVNPSLSPNPSTSPSPSPSTSPCPTTINNQSIQTLTTSKTHESTNGSLKLLIQQLLQLLQQLLQQNGEQLPTLSPCPQPSVSPSVSPSLSPSVSPSVSPGTSPSPSSSVSASPSVSSSPGGGGGSSGGGSGSKKKKTKTKKTTSDAKKCSNAGGSWNAKKKVCTCKKDFEHSNKKDQFSKCVAIHKKKPAPKNKIHKKKTGLVSCTITNSCQPGNPNPNPGGKGVIGTACSVNGNTGICEDVKKPPAGNGKFYPNHCPGPSTIQCWVGQCKPGSKGCSNIPIPQSPANQACINRGGTCESVKQCPASSSCAFICDHGQTCVVPIKTSPTQACTNAGGTCITNQSCRNKTIQCHPLNVACPAGYFCNSNAQPKQPPVQLPNVYCNGVRGWYCSLATPWCSYASPSKKVYCDFGGTGVCCPEKGVSGTWPH